MTTSPLRPSPASACFVSRSRLIGAPADAVFDLLAHPSMHAVIDGSGSVRSARDGDGERLSLGARFGMDMHIIKRYSIVNTVTEFEEGRRIAWHNASGSTWRYVLEEVEGGTLVTEQWDARTSPRRLLMRLLGMPKRIAAGIEETLSNLDSHLTHAQ